MTVAAPATATDFDRGRTAVLAEDWNAAMIYLRQHLSTGDDPRASQLLETAKREMRNRAFYELFEVKLGEGDLLTAAELFQEVSPDSVYRARGEPTLRAAEAELERRSREEQLALEAGRSHESRHDSRHESRRESRRGPRPAASAAAAPPIEDIGAIIARAREAILRHDYATARRDVDEALRRDPTNQHALQLGAMASCRLGEPDSDSSRYVESLTDSRRDAVRRYCLATSVR
jgi:hypothetical protein